MYTQTNEVPGSFVFEALLISRIYRLGYFLELSANVNALGFNPQVLVSAIKLSREGCFSESFIVITICILLY